MLETADRIETSTREITPDRTAGSSTSVGAPPDEVPGPARFGRILLGCLVVEALIVAIALASLAGGRTSAAPDVDPNPDRTAEPVSVSGSASGDDHIESFLGAWRRSLDQDHLAVGTVTRTVLDRSTLFTSAWPDSTAGTADAATTVWPYRHTRLDGQVLTQIGDVATVVHRVEGRWTCFRQADGFACTADQGSTGDVMTTVEQAVTGSTATHRVIEIHPEQVLAGFPGLPADMRCWETRSSTDGVDQRWGRRAQFCFDDASGAAVFRRILGTTRVEVLVVESVSEIVSPTDLDPA